MASLAFRLRQRYWRFTAPRKIGRYLAGARVAKQQIGSGHNLLGDWLNTTLYPFEPGTVYLDASRPFPIPAASLNYVFSEHVIEHLEFDEAALMLRECFRTLKAGGRIRLATPDLKQIIAIYTQPEADAQQEYIRWIMDQFRPHIGEYNPAHVVNHSFHGWRHKSSTTKRHWQTRSKGPAFAMSSALSPARVLTSICAALSSMANMSAARRPCATKLWSSRQANHRPLPAQDLLCKSRRFSATLR